MAFIRSSTVRSIPIFLLVVVLAAVFLPGSAIATPHPPTPTVGSVTKQLDALANQAEKLAERYNAAQLAVGRQQRLAAAALRTSAAAASSFDTARATFSRFALAQFEGGSSSFGSTGALLTSGNPQVYLDSLTTEQMLSTQAAGVLATFQSAKIRADATRSAAQTLLAAAQSKRDLLANQRHALMIQTAKVQTLLATLTASQQQSYRNRNAPSQAQVAAAFKVHAGSAAAQRAVDFAIAQVGKPYVWAAAEPDAFDCSGLTMAAWARGGVSLPHLASAQYNYGTRVPYTGLQPGDLVFLYSDIHHVEIYIGNGLAVSAPQPGENVKIVRVADARSDFHGATRLT